MQHPTDKVAAHIIRVVSANKRGILGTDLMSAIRLQFPGFAPVEYGTLKLRNFIERFVPAVGPSGRSGGDFFYSVKGQPREQIETLGGTGVSGSTHLPPTYDGSVWKTFTSPGGLYRLYAQKGTGQLTVCPPGASPPDDTYVQIEAIAGEKHMEFAKDFVSTLTEEAQKERLSRWFDRPQWWIPFYESVKTEGLAAGWNAMRRKRIIEELKRALDAAGVPTEGVEEQVAVVPKNPLRYPPAFRPAAPSASIPEIPRTQSSLKLRAVAERIVQEMSIAELRNLRVRLGDVFDALNG